MLALAWEMTKPFTYKVPRRPGGPTHPPTHDTDEFKAGDSDVAEDSDEEDDSLAAAKRANPDVQRFYEAIPEAHNLASIMNTRRKKSLRSLKSGKVHIDLETQTSQRMRCCFQAWSWYAASSELIMMIYGRCLLERWMAQLQESISSPPNGCGGTASRSTRVWTTPSPSRHGHLVSMPPACAACAT